jgi:DNA-binding protein HU-beta
VTISGFGTFVVTRRATRNGRDPRTGQEIKIPAARVPRFKASKALRDGIR